MLPLTVGSSQLVGRTIASGVLVSAALASASGPALVASSAVSVAASAASCPVTGLPVAQLGSSLQPAAAGAGVVLPERAPRARGKTQSKPKRERLTLVILAERGERARRRC